MAKKFLSQNSISYIEKDINADEQARNELRKRNISGVPTFFIGEQVIVGLDKTKILELVDHRTVACNKCHARLRVPIDRGPLKVTCPRCKNIFDWKPQ